VQPEALPSARLPATSPLARPAPSASPEAGASPIGQPAPVVSALPGSPGAGAGTLLPLTPLHDPLIQGSGGGSSGGGSSGAGQSLPTPSPTPLFYIADVQLAETGQSVMGTQASGQIQADYAGESVELLISGNFGDPAPAHFAFATPAGVLYQTFVTEMPASRVLLNDTLLLEVLVANPQQLRVRLPRQYLNDLYVLGLHKLSVEHPPYYADVQVRVDEPVYTADLLPRIQAVEVLTDDQGQPHRLRLTGTHIPINPRFFHTTIQGEFAFGHQTRILSDGNAAAELYLPDTAAFLTAGPEYHLVFSTPFGTTPHSFTWEPEP